MNERDPREELAGIARGLRRALELERAAGTGELLASSAKAASARGTGRARPAAAPPPPGATSPAGDGASRSSATSRAPAPRATTGAGAAAPVAPPVHVNLFGEPEPVAAAAAPPALEFELPESHAPLNPGGLTERAPIESDSAPVLEAVAREVRACRLCGLCEARANAVPGAGSAKGGIVFVGEAPGAEEDRQGEPFVGRAGELLTKIIKAMDDARLIPGVPLTRETVYICNVLKCRPPENRNPLPHEVDLCSPYLRRQLDALKPRVICCLGKFAAELLVGVKGTIAGLRGRTYHYQGAGLIVTYHPAACLRNPNLKRPVWDDMQLLARGYQSE
jgi:DNA polymerase